MLALRELQLGFAAAVLDGAPAIAGIRGGVFTADERLNVYRHNVASTLRDALLATFPATAAVLGGEQFTALARNYLQQHPSRAGHLGPLGHAFPEYLASTGAHAALVDLAALEWAMEAVLAAAAPPSLDRDGLGQCVARNEDPVLLRHPGCRVLASSHPVLSLWELAQSPATAAGALASLDAGPEHVLVRRTDDGAEVRSISADVTAFLATLGTAMPLSSALQAAVDMNPDFDLARHLATALALGLLADPTASGPDFHPDDLEGSA